MKKSEQPLQQIPFDLPVRPAFGRDDFLVGDENKTALAFLDRWPDWPAPALVLTGPAASGKTHLSALWQNRAHAVRIDARHLPDGDAEALYASSDNLIIDDVDFWIGERESEATLFHLYNMAKEKGGSLLLTMRAAPTQLDFVLPDLASRVRAAPVVNISAPQEALLSAVLIKQFHDRQLQISAELVRYIMPRIERSFAAVRDLVEQADSLALAQKKPVSITLVRQIMAQ